MTSVWKYNEEFRLQIGVSSDCANICSQAPRKIENGVYRRSYNHEIDKKFDSPNALNVTKTSRWRYAGQMIKSPEDLPQKALFRAKPIGRRKSRKIEIQVGGWVEQR
jgi:hypothetical protein